MFKGGLTAADIARMRSEKLKEKEGKEQQEKEKEDREHASEPKDAGASLRRSRDHSGLHIREELVDMEAKILAAFESHVESFVGRFGFEKKIADLQSAVLVLSDIEERVKFNISDAVEVMQGSVIQSILDFLKNPISSAPPGRSSSPSGSSSGESANKGNDDIPDKATDATENAKVIPFNFSLL